MNKYYANKYIILNKLNLYFLGKKTAKIHTFCVDIYWPPKLNNSESDYI